MGDTAFKDMAILRELARYVFSYGAGLDRYTAEDLEDSKRLYGAMYLLMSQSQALIDMAERAVSLLGLSARCCADAGGQLMIHGVFTENDFKLYMNIVKFRNALVNKYQVVKIEIVKDIVLNRRYKQLIDLALKIVERFGEDL
ncbi:DUF86 domain-containing protein [Pyrobaculum sp. 3827-6]|uniref:DUF86 domain-containing protein n=1 Tax=Pyrobaculum sp. 3827-6 TaxID=2983604 RepID=UPI0021D81902|nr:DUF86 domain-containing protein [Pyrobaculum sp. 3827-6]MCU7788482.1 DUF86 domain-containing protein [Pyrobaculum sp. 3827-6]